MSFFAARLGIGGMGNTDRAFMCVCICLCIKTLTRLQGGVQKDIQQPPSKCVIGPQLQGPMHLRGGSSMTFSAAASHSHTQTQTQTSNRRLDQNHLSYTTVTPPTANTHSSTLAEKSGALTPRRYAQPALPARERYHAVIIFPSAATCCVRLTAPAPLLPRLVHLVPMP